MFAQMRREAEEANVKREEQLLENEHKRQKVNAEMQIEIERQRAAVETNRMMVNNEIMERREVEYITRNEREKQELLGLKENEKLEMKACYEQQMALERRLSEEKEKRLRSENQVHMLLEKKEPPLPPLHLVVSRPAASAASVTSTQVFAKSAVPYKSMVRDVMPSPRSSPRLATSHKLHVSNGTFVSILAPNSKPFSVHMATPRISCTLASATMPMTTTSIQTLQPKNVADETKMATVTAVVPNSDAAIVSCSTNVADVVKVMDASNVVLHANVVQSQNVVPQAPVLTQSAGTEPKIAQNLGYAETKVSPPVELKSSVSEGHTLTSAPSAIPKLSPEQPQVVPIQPVPTVIVRPPTAPKGYSRSTSYKAYKEYFKRLSICNGWTSPLMKTQNLLINLEGAASEAVRGLEVTSDADYDKIWEMLKRRFSFQNDIEQNRRAFDRKRQEDNESVAQFELSL